MDSDDTRRAADGLAEILASIEAGKLDTTPAERAYLAGALHALRAVLGEASPDFGNALL